MYAAPLHYHILIMPNGIPEYDYFTGPEVFLLLWKIFNPWMWSVTIIHLWLCPQFQVCEYAMATYCDIPLDIYRKLLVVWVRCKQLLHQPISTKTFGIEEVCVYNNIMQCWSFVINFYTVRVETSCVAVQLLHWKWLILMAVELGIFVIVQLF